MTLLYVRILSKLAYGRTWGAKSLVGVEIQRRKYRHLTASWTGTSCRDPGSREVPSLNADVIFRLRIPYLVAAWLGARSELATSFPILRYMRRSTIY